MDQTQLLLLLALAAIVALTVLGLLVRSRPGAAVTPEGSDSPLGVSTEGMKKCPKCGMGNLWTDRACISCRTPLRG